MLCAPHSPETLHPQEPNWSSVPLATVKLKLISLTFAQVNISTCTFESCIHSKYNGTFTQFTASAATNRSSQDVEYSLNDAWINTTAVSLLKTSYGIINGSPGS